MYKIFAVSNGQVIGTAEELSIDDAKPTTSALAIFGSFRNYFDVPGMITITGKIFNLRILSEFQDNYDLVLFHLKYPNLESNLTFDDFDKSYEKIVLRNMKRAGGVVYQMGVWINFNGMFAAESIEFFIPDHHKQLCPDCLTFMKGLL